MKQTALLFVSLMAALGAQAQGSYTVKGNLKNADGKSVYLYAGDSREVEADSAVVTGGSFTFKGETKVPFMDGSLVLGNPQDYMNAKMVGVAIEPLTITVSGDTDDWDNITIKGGKAQDEANRMKEEMSAFVKPLEELGDQYYQLDQAGRDSLTRLMAPYQKQYGDYSRSYYATRTGSYYATRFLMMDMGNMKYEDLKAAWEKLSPEVRQYGCNAKEIKAELEVLAKVRPGSPAPDFTATDITGKPFTLSSLQGKVVIIDFWASWCVPCRKSNPHMRELYAKYHAQGLDLVYVADDDSNPDKWHAAVEKDQLTGDGFHHVLRGFKMDRATGVMDKTNDISDKYAVHYLPTKYLIDRQGNIVCKIDEGQDEMLDAQIAELLNNTAPQKTHNKLRE